MTAPWLFCNYKGIAQANSCNPLSWTFNTTGYNMMNVGNPFSTMIPLLDQAFWHQQAMSGMYMIPQMNLGFGCGMDSVFNTLLNKSTYDVFSNTNYTNAGNNGFFGNFGNIGNFGGNIWSNMGYYGPVAPKSSGNNDDDNDEYVMPAEAEARKKEEAFKAKYNELKAFVELLYKRDELNKKEGSPKKYLTPEQAAEIKIALEDNKNSFETRYNNLRTAYDKVSDEKVKEFTLNEDITFKIDGVDNNLAERLSNTGHEESDDTDAMIEKLYQEINSLTAANASSATFENLSALLDADKYNILDVISSWNTSQSKDLMQLITEKYDSDKMKDGNARDTVKTSTITKLVSALKTEAGKVCSQLDPVKDANAIKNIKIAMNNLQISVDNTTTGKNGKAGKNLNYNFELLYTLTRVAATMVLERDLKNKYNTIDSGVFQEGLLYDNVKNDLDNEGELQKGLFTNVCSYLGYKKEATQTIIVNTGSQATQNTIASNKVVSFIDKYIEKCDKDKKFERLLAWKKEAVILPLLQRAKELGLENDTNYKKVDEYKNQASSITKYVKEFEALYNLVKEKEASATT